MGNDDIVNATRHATFYFPDGDLVIQSTGSQGEECTPVLFRVNKSVLAFNSPVFADMFALPIGPTQDMHEGAPLVHVTDTAEQWSDLLSALYNPR